MVDDLLKYGEVHRGTIGGIVTIDRLTPQTAEELGRQRHTGRGGHAHAARVGRGYDVGIRPGDVIVRFNNTAIDDPSQLYRVVADARSRIDRHDPGAAQRPHRWTSRVPIVSDARDRVADRPDVVARKQRPLRIHPPQPS